MLLLVAIDQECLDSIWYIRKAIETQEKTLRVTIVFTASLSLSGTRTFTFPNAHTEFPYLFFTFTFLQRVVRLEDGEKGRMHSHSSWLAIYLGSVFVHSSLFMWSHVRQGLLTPSKTNLPTLYSKLHTESESHTDSLLWELSFWFTGNLYRESRTGTGSLAGHSRG